MQARTNRRLRALEQGHAPAEPITLAIIDWSPDEAWGQGTVVAEYTITPGEPFDYFRAVSMLGGEVSDANA